MSAFVAGVVAVAMFLAIGGDTERVMQGGVWEMWASASHESHRPGVRYTDSTLECAKAQARNRPCEFNLGSVLRMMDRGVKKRERGRPIPVLQQPRWVPALREAEKSLRLDDKAAWLKLAQQWQKLAQEAEDNGM